MDKNIRIPLAPQFRAMLMYGLVPINREPPKWHFPTERKCLKIHKWPRVPSHCLRRTTWHHKQPFAKVYIRLGVWQWRLCLHYCDAIINLYNLSTIYVLVGGMISSQNGCTCHFKSIIPVDDKQRSGFSALTSRLSPTIHPVVCLQKVQIRHQGIG